MPVRFQSALDVQNLFLKQDGSIQPIEQFTLCLEGIKVHPNIYSVSLNYASVVIFAVRSSKTLAPKSN